jgi:hypothetical protein
MKSDETGEFELVLGNRQLLSGFFVVVVLFAVFFVMGYLVGRNASPSTTKSAAPAEQPAANPSPTDTHPSASPAAPAAQNPPAAAPQSGSDEQAAASKDSPPPAADNAAASPQSTSAPANPAADGSTPAPGEIYLQVVSVAQHDAELVSRTLKEKGFPSSLSPGPNGRTRVLVGPYTEVGALGKAKADLENLGFHPIVKK